VTKHFGWPVSTRLGHQLPTGVLVGYGEPGLALTAELATLVDVRNGPITVPVETECKLHMMPSPEMAFGKR
jgi:hypothetical protein